MDYFQTEVYLPIEKEWRSAGSVSRDGNFIDALPSEKLTHEQAQATLTRLRAQARNLDFRIAPWGND